MNTKTIISETLNKLSNGISTALFHCLIRLSFAVKSDKQEEIIRELAYYACAYTPIETNARQIGNKDVCSVRDSLLPCIG